VPAEHDVAEAARAREARAGARLALEERPPLLRGEGRALLDDPQVKRLYLGEGAAV